MEINESQRRFGQVAQEKGFLTRKQYIKAQNIQIKEKMEQETNRAIGEILLGLGYLTQEQIDAVLEDL